MTDYRQAAARPKMTITYLTEPIGEYAAFLSEADTLDKLREGLERYRLIAYDACIMVATWGQRDFKDWRKALASERRGRYMGDDNAKWFAAVLMPEVMFRVGIIAEQFKCPWGCAYIRMRELGKIHEHKGVATLR